MPTKSGWYACRLAVTDNKVKEVIASIALQLVDVTDDGVAIDSMRWCRGRPHSARNAKCWGQTLVYFKHAIDTPAPRQDPAASISSQTQHVAPGPPAVKTQHVVKQEFPRSQDPARREARQASKKKAPYAEISELVLSKFER